MRLTGFTTAFLCAALLAMPAPAQDQAELQRRYDLGVPMSAQEFDQMTLGRTITYSNGYMDVYREYYPVGTGRRVILEWLVQGDGDACQIGSWRPDGDLICFDWLGSGSVCSGWVVEGGVVISQIYVGGEPGGGFEPISRIELDPIDCSQGMVSLPGVPADTTPQG